MKKTRYRLSSRLPYWLGMFLCLLGSVASAIFFSRSISTTLSRQNEEPIAVIAAKTRIVQRKLSDRVLWDRLTATSPVYNGDTLHTASLSRGLLRFSDGSEFTLAENTMVQVFLLEDGTFSASLSQGSVDIETKGGPLSLLVKGKKYEIAASSQVLAALPAAAGESPALQVQAGSLMLPDGMLLQDGGTVGDQSALSDGLSSAAALEDSLGALGLAPLAQELRQLEPEEPVLAVAHTPAAKPKAQGRSLPPTVATVSYSGYMSQEMLLRLRGGVAAFSQATVVVSLDLSHAFFYTIPSNAFSGCARLERLILPSSIKKIEKDAFSNCPILTVVGYAGSESQWQAVEVLDEAVKAIVPRCNYSGE